MAKLAALPWDAILGAEVVQAYKPAPDVLHAAMSALGARPEECLMEGDSTADMAAGRAAGVKTCAVRYGYGNQEEMARLQPDYWIDDLRALVG